MSELSSTIHLTIGTNYVSHWGFWEALREILQNAIDTKDYKVRQMESSGYVFIDSNGGKLDLSSLMLGETTKADQEDTIGKYGEGYKLALIVLCRMGYEVHVKNGVDHWSVTIGEHPQLGCNCLIVDVTKDVHPEEDWEKVTFVIGRVKSEDFEALNNKYIGDKMDIFDIKAESGGNYCFDYGSPKGVFVSGLWICDLDEKENYMYSYSFKPDRIKLDRDRGSVSDFELKWEATRLIVDSGDCDLLSDMCIKKAAEISNHVLPIHDKKTEDKVDDFFTAEYGSSSFAIREDYSEQRKVELTERAVKQGLTPVVVNPALHEMLPAKTKTLTGKPLTVDRKSSEILREYIKLNNKQLTSLGKKRLIEVCLIIEKRSQ